MVSRSETYQQMAEDAKAFRDAYRTLLSHLTEADRYLTGGLASYRPKPGKEAAAAEASAEVSQLAGKAIRAQRMSEVRRTYVVPNIGIPLDPFSSWDHSLKDVGAMSPQDVVNTCALVIGALEEKAQRAAAVDRTFVGRLAAFVSIPARIRAVVAEDHPGLGKLAFSTGVVAQIFIAIVSTLITAAITAGVAAIWKEVVSPTPGTTLPASPPTTAASTPAATTPPSLSATPTQSPTPTPS